MAVKLKIVLFLSTLSSLVQCEENFPIVVRKYELDDPDKCSENNGIFCKISVTLVPHNSTFDSRAWKIVEETSQDFRYFDRAKLLHGRCFKKYQIRTLNQALQEEYSTRYLNESLHGIVNNFRCFEKGRLILDDVDYWDLLFGSIAVIYGLFMVGATTYTYLADHEKDNFLVKILSIFSFVTIWKELKKPILNEDFQKLKSIQGLRTLTMMLIISMHAFYGNMFTFLNNPEYVENIYSNIITRCLVTIFTFLVQTFFLISAWLLTIQLSNIIKKNGDLTFKDVVILGINRYFRLLPVIIVLLLALRSNLTFDVISYINEDIAEREVEICRYYWWKNLLFIQNFYESDKICSGVTWYLATDYQLYLLTLGLFYVGQKLKISRKYLIGLTIITTVATQVGVIANTNFQGFMRLIPRTANLEDMMVSNAFIWSYIPVWCNSITYMVGVIFGTIYFKHKQEKLFEENHKKILWFLGFFGFPILALVAASYQYETRIYEILVSILARPLFGIGIGIGILGMATRTGGLIKIILELKPLVFLANFCYCVYLSHYAFVFVRILRQDEIVDLSMFYIAKYTLIDYTLSFSFGALVYMAVEHPFIQLQKLILPQVKTKKESIEETPKPTKTVNTISA
ncbi:O-acyltransferase like protein-like [Coccinella septempunctata]|uniref:O-acyltransferase like protein-like n=1 Tax=Coccinella septempunctata TaxID=41139 RepID=UPI001D09927E|nr:O-acyltransferase like protein-like [Coccinella septempunctata]XP_044746771.1 O-acyltransferase like protein-like [Coccinella septempunctata]